MLNSNDTLKDSIPVKEQPKLKPVYYPTPFPTEHGLSRKEREFNDMYGGW